MSTVEENLEDNLAYMEVDLALAEVLASWENNDTYLSDEDRELLAMHFRAAYLQGHKDGALAGTQHAIAFFKPIMRKLVKMLKDAGLDVLSDPAAT